MAEPKKEVCRLSIIFPVESDEQAIEYKKKISALLVEIPDAQINFSLMTMPNGGADVYSRPRGLANP